jgi:hypothetical protein
MPVIAIFPLESFVMYAFTTDTFDPWSAGSLELSAYGEPSWLNTNVGSADARGVSATAIATATHANRTFFISVLQICAGLERPFRYDLDAVTESSAFVMARLTLKREDQKGETPPPGGLSPLFAPQLKQL